MSEAEKAKAKILEAFKDVNQMYNNCNMYDDLSGMLDELIEKAHDEGDAQGQRHEAMSGRWSNE